VNKDILDHTGTARNGAWDVAVEPGKTGKVQLKGAGTIEYYCRLHPNMVGKITVK
jgi:plastocyanin